MQRKVVKQVKGYSAVDGGGVHLSRVLGYQTAKEFDPILMLDSFDSKDPKEYQAGFPAHPHRGIETISYLVKGKMQHKDNLGFEDTISDGEVQWMTAGSGIIHEERLPISERLLGVQLWLNLPAKDKMTTPAYQSIKSTEIEEVEVEGGRLRVLAGSFQGTQGFQGKYHGLDYYDVEVFSGDKVCFSTKETDKVILFTLEGEVEVGGEGIPEKTAVLLSQGDGFEIKAKEKGARVLYLSSQPLGEEIVWGGPIVMNTKEELQQAFQELEMGTFIK